MKTRTFAAPSFSLHLKLFFVAALFCAITLALAPAPAHAASLTSPQIEAVLGLLEAFNVPQDTISNVRAILYGNSEGQPVSTKTKAYLNPVAYAPMPPQAPQAPMHSRAASSYVSGPSLVAAAATVPFVATADSLNILADQMNEVNDALLGVLSAYVALFSMEAIPHAAAAAKAPAPAPYSSGESLLATLAYLPESLYETAANTTDFLAAVEMAPVYVITDALSETLFEAGLY